RHLSHTSRVLSQSLLSETGGLGDFEAISALSQDRRSMRRGAAEIAEQVPFSAKRSCVSTLALDRWVFFQLGAREHYAVPRALHERGTLAALFTDAWADPSSALKRLSSRLVTRFEPRLKDARVEHFTSSLLLFEARRAFLRSWGTNSWDDIIARNRWF